MISLIPFSTVGSTAQSHAYVVENIIMFIPFGFLLPQLWAHMRNLGLCLLSAFITSMVIEVTQVVTKMGYGQTDDCLLYTSNPADCHEDPVTGKVGHLFCIDILQFGSDDFLFVKNSGYPCLLYTSGYLWVCIAYGKIKYEQWFKFIIPLIGIWYLACMILLVIAQGIGW